MSKSDRFSNAAPNTLFTCARGSALYDIDETKVLCPFSGHRLAAVPAIDGRYWADDGAKRFKCRVLWTGRRVDASCLSKGRGRPSFGHDYEAAIAWLLEDL